MELYKLNKNIEYRDKILFGEYNPKLYIGGLRNFKKVPHQVIQKLIDENFIDINDKQNNAPTIQEFMKFSNSIDKVVLFYGYAVNLKRSDYRISIDGILIPPESINEIDNLAIKFKRISINADTIIKNPFDTGYFAWWD